MPVTGSHQATTSVAESLNGARRKAHPALVLLIIAGAQLMVVLDGTIVNIALPSMGHYFHKNQTDMTWALNAYTLAFGGLLLLGGRSGDILGRRKMFVIGLSLFTLGSLLAGVAGSFGFLLFGRAVQGVGGAIASPTALSLITTEFEEGKERTRAIAVYAAVSGAGAALGLLLGGILTNYLSWRWVLFVNVPIGVLLITGAFLYLHQSERLKGRFDFVGAGLSVAGMFTLVYGFIHVAHDGWGNGETFLLFALAIALLVGFVLFEAFGTKTPMMPMRIFDNRSRSGSYLVMLIVGAAMFGMFYFITFFVQGVLAYSPLKAGFAFLPVAFVIGITSQVVAQLMPRTGPRPLIATGTIVLSLALLWLSTVGADSTYWGTLFPGMMVMAVSLGFIFVPILSTAVSKVSNTDAGLASALVNVGQQVGGTIGLAVLATVAATSARNSSASHAKDLVQQYGPQSEHVQHFGQLGKAFSDGTVAPPAARGDSVAVHAVNAVQAHSSGMGFLTAAIFAIVAIAAAVLLITVKKSDLPSPEQAMAAAAA